MLFAATALLTSAPTRSPTIPGPTSVSSKSVSEVGTVSPDAVPTLTRGTSIRAAAGAPPTIPAGRLQFYGRTVDGRPLNWTNWRQLQTNDAGDPGVNDMLVDPTELTVVRPWPLYNSRGIVTLDRPSRPVSLALAWPFTQGYAALIVDLPGPGTYDFHALAAAQVIKDVKHRLQLLSPLPPDSIFETALHDADSSLARSRRTSGASGEFLAASSFQQAALASARLATHLAPRVVQANEAVCGYTVTEPSTSTEVRLVSRLLSGSSCRGAVRLVFDHGVKASAYQTSVDAAHSAGLLVVGQLADSSDLARYSLSGWRTRVDSYLLALPDVDRWEVGNEINGDWLGFGVVDKLRYALDAVKSRTRAGTLITLYWDLGESQPSSSLFTWLHEHWPPELTNQVDEVGLSVYPQEHPLGIGMDRVIRRLHALFPDQRVSISELGYGGEDLEEIWWFGRPGRPDDSSRAAVANFYGHAIRGYPYSAGGSYWWYISEDVQPDNELWGSLKKLAHSLR